MSLLNKSLSLAGLALVVSVGYFVFAPVTQAAPGDTTLTGWAWSSNVGWISLNCDHTADGTASPDNTNSCGVSNYKVQYDSNPASGDFTGYAWSSNIGWIDFNASGGPAAPTYAAKFGAAPVSDCASGREIKGWAKALSAGGSSGWDGWISMSGNTTGGTHYGVCLNSSGGGLGGEAPCFTSSDPMNCGYAWGGDVVGWIQFNNTFSRSRPTIIEVKPQ